MSISALFVFFLPVAFGIGSAISLNRAADRYEMRLGREQPRDFGIPLPS
jgi:hypothetical protein